MKFFTEESKLLFYKEGGETCSPNRSFAAARHVRYWKSLFQIESVPHDPQGHQGLASHLNVVSCQPSHDKKPFFTWLPQVGVYIDLLFVLLFVCSA